jgi:hypothetical protein
LNPRSNDGPRTEHEFDDESLARDIRRLQQAIERWAIGHNIWFDCGFKTYAEHVKAEPGNEPVVCVLYFSSDFQPAVIGDLDMEFWELVSSHGFHYENANGYNLHFYPDEGPRCDAYARYFHWQWICSLVRPDFADVHEELYGHFATRPDDMHRLDWRQYEVLVARILQTQGFEAELGPGRGDGGVDIRLLQRAPLGDILTLVQVKKYAPKNRIGLQAVQALFGAAAAYGAQRSMFVTTSSYEPVARRFAARDTVALELYESNDVAAWCRTAKEGIIEDKSSLVAPASVERLLLEVAQGAHPRLVHAHTGATMVLNEFAVVLKETKHAALLMEIPRRVLSHDGSGQRGEEVPKLDASAMLGLKADTVWRAMRSVDEEGRVSYWDGRNLYGAWDGKPQHFDFCD